MGFVCALAIPVFGERVMALQSATPEMPAGDALEKREASKAGCRCLLLLIIIISGFPVNRSNYPDGFLTIVL